MSSDVITFDKHNYRKHSDKNKSLIRKSLEECGAGRSIITDKNGEIIAGNGVYEQAKALNIPVKIIETDGSELVVVKRTDLATEDEKRKKLALMDNSASDQVEWDLDNITSDFTLEQLPEFGIESLPQVVEEGEVVDVEVPNPEDVVTRCKPGDLWILGRHKLLCGDATSITDIEKLMETRKADMVFTDPPYNVNYGASMKDTLRKKDGQKSAGRTIMNDNLGDNFKQFLTDACLNIVNFCRGAIYICMSSSELHTLYNSFVESGGKWSTFIIWAKNTFTLGRSDYQRQYEPILYGWPQGAKHHWCGDRDQSDVWEYNKPQVNDLHPTMKPLELVARAIKNSSRPNDIVADFFGGSGSTLIACEQLNRVCYMSELDPKFCDVILTRWEKLTGQEAKLCK